MNRRNFIKLSACLPLLATVDIKPVKAQEVASSTTTGFMQIIANEKINAGDVVYLNDNGLLTTTAMGYGLGISLKTVSRFDKVEYVSFGPLLK